VRSKTVASRATRTATVKLRLQGSKHLNLLAKGMVIVPLTVKIVGHIDNVVHDLTDSRNGKAFQIPVGCRCGNGESLSLWQSIPNKLQKREIVRPIRWAPGRNAWDVWSTRILPVEIKPIKVILIEELLQFSRLYERVRKDILQPRYSRMFGGLHR
jgi:hypothetical protein